MRLVVARCSVVYEGRGSTVLPEAVRLIMIKRDGSLSVHSDDRAYRPLNWLLPPCTWEVLPPQRKPGRRRRGEPAAHPTAAHWILRSSSEQLDIHISEILSDTSHDLEEAEPGLIRSWTEPHLQAWIAGHVSEVFGEGWQFCAREVQTGAGPVDLVVRDPDGQTVAVEVKRTATMNAVDQVGRYVEALNGDPAWAPARGLVVALAVKPRARELAETRSVTWLEIPTHLYRRP